MATINLLLFVTVIYLYKLTYISGISFCLQTDIGIGFMSLAVPSRSSSQGDAAFVICC